MHWFWPFPTPRLPDDALLNKFQTLFESVYWLGVKDGLTIAVIGMLLFFVLFHRERDK